MKRENTIQAFAPGDVFVSCTWLNDPDDDHRGWGRIIQYDADLNEKGVLWIEGTKHFIVGLKFDSSGLLWGFDMHAQVVIHVDCNGVQRPIHHFADRAFGSVHFTREGDLYFGEYLIGTQIHRGTTSKTIPGSDLLGHGNLHHFNANWELVEELEVENVEELTGFKGLTHGSIHPSDTFITYTSETGKRLLRYHLQEKRQMPDLVTPLGGEIYDKNWFIALHYLQCGHLMVTRGESVDIYDETGILLRNIELGRYGWAQITSDADETFVYAANVWTGEVCKVDLAAGEVIAMVETSNSQFSLEAEQQQREGTYKGSRAPKRAAAGIAVYCP